LPFCFQELDRFKRSSSEQLRFCFVTLAPYGITAATLTALQTRISAYVAVIGAPRVVRVKISTATEMLDTEFARADMILNDRIDGLMEQFKDSGTSFYADYKNARRIVDTGSQGEPPAPPPPGP
jgi:hypothetical protein